MIYFAIAPVGLGGHLLELAAAAEYWIQADKKSTHCLFALRLGRDFIMAAIVVIKDLQLEYLSVEPVLISAL